MDPAMREWVGSRLEVVDVVEVRQRPWAQVWRVHARDGLWWAKANSPATGHEPRLLGRLGALAPDFVPRSHTHEARPWTLTLDAGQSARENLSGAEPARVVSFWCELLARATPSCSGRSMLVR